MAAALVDGVEDVEDGVGFAQGEGGGLGEGFVGVVQQGGELQGAESAAHAGEEVDGVADGEDGEEVPSAGDFAQEIGLDAGGVGHAAGDGVGQQRGESRGGGARGGGEASNEQVDESTGLVGVKGEGGDAHAGAEGDVFLIGGVHGAPPGLWTGGFRIILEGVGLGNPSNGTGSSSIPFLGCPVLIAFAPENRAEPEYGIPP